MIEALPALSVSFDACGGTLQVQASALIGQMLMMAGLGHLLIEQQPVT